VILIGQQAVDLWRWPHFKPEELRSRGAGEPDLVVETEFLDRLERLRVRYARPMPINSGYRTPQHNAVVSKTGTTGPHTTGRAVDVRVTGPDAVDLVRLAFMCGFTGVGVSQKGGAARFIHLDDLAAPAFPRPAIWSY
jgi:zinc D-Ala-D-Ala carboxypeptidase